MWNWHTCVSMDCDSPVIPPNNHNYKTWLTEWSYLSFPSNTVATTPAHIHKFTHLTSMQRPCKEEQHLLVHVSSLSFVIVQQHLARAVIMWFLLLFRWVTRHTWGNFFRYHHKCLRHDEIFFGCSCRSSDIEGSQPECCTSSTRCRRDTPFWSGTPDI